MELLAAAASSAPDASMQRDVELARPRDAREELDPESKEGERRVLFFGWLWIFRELHWSKYGDGNCFQL